MLALYHATCTRVQQLQLVMSLSRSSLTIDSCIHGYHEYSTIWEPVMGEELQCDREVDNLHDPYAVSVLKYRQIVGHAPHSIYRSCSVFLWSHGSRSRTFLQVLR